MPCGGHAERGLIMSFAHFLTHTALGVIHTHSSALGAPDIHRPLSVLPSLTGRIRLEGYISSPSFVHNGYRLAVRLEQVPLTLIMLIALVCHL